MALYLLNTLLGVVIAEGSQVIGSPFFYKALSDNMRKIF